MRVLLHFTILLNYFLPGGSFNHEIVGGHRSVPHSHPFMAYLWDPWNKKECDGILVNEEFVLSAAHCYTPSMLVFLGVSNNKKLTPSNFTFAKKIVHPLYNNKTYANDIMLLKLDTPTTLNNFVMPIDMPKSKNEKFAHNCTVMGWGSKNFRCSCSSRNLREVNVNIVTDDECLGHDMICSKGFKGPSTGDSGGPLVCDNVARGIVSNNLQINGGYMARYVRIDYHLDWIHSVMNKSYSGL